MPPEGSCGGCSEHKGEMKKSREKTKGEIPGKICSHSPHSACVQLTKDADSEEY